MRRIQSPMIVALLVLSAALPFVGLAVGGDSMCAVAQVSVLVFWAVLFVATMPPMA